MPQSSLRTPLGQTVSLIYELGLSFHRIVDLNYKRLLVDFLLILVVCQIMFLIFYEKKNKEVRAKISVRVKAL